MGPISSDLEPSGFPPWTFVGFRTSTGAGQSSASHSPTYEQSVIYRSMTRGCLGMRSDRCPKKTIFEHTVSPNLLKSYALSSFLPILVIFDSSLFLPNKWHPSSLPETPPHFKLPTNHHDLCPCPCLMCARDGSWLSRSSLFQSANGGNSFFYVLTSKFRHRSQSNWQAFLPVFMGGLPTGMFSLCYRSSTRATDSSHSANGSSGAKLAVKSGPEESLPQQNKYTT